MNGGINGHSREGWGTNGNNKGPCGACKFLRRKCAKGCVFAPYFDSEQGTTHFAAVHKVFGASNASKLLLRLPANRRLDAVVTLCYEALSRVADPVYGCVGQIFTLQQQLIALQAELAYVQAQLSTLRHCPPMQTPEHQSLSPPLNPKSSLGLASTSGISTMHIEPALSDQVSFEMASFCNDITNPLSQGFDEGDLEMIAREFVSKYLPGVKIHPSSSG